MRKILIVEDDTLLNRTLGYNLASDGYEITAAYNHKDAVFHWKAICSKAMKQAARTM